jgi:hypothetical protein
MSYRLEIDESPIMPLRSSTLPTSYLAEKMPVSRRAALRLSEWISSAVLLATCYLPGHFSQNHLSLEVGHDGEQLHITGETPPETQRLLRLAGARLSGENAPI